jgi:hypothetical protein
MILKYSMSYVHCMEWDLISFKGVIDWIKLIYVPRGVYREQLEHKRNMCCHNPMK